MAEGAGNSFDFFLSRRGSVAAIAREVESVLAERGYKVFVQDYDIRLGASSIAAMHEAIKSSRNLIILFTHDYEASPYTRKEFTSFEADRHHGGRQDRHIVVLRCEDVPLRGLLADTVYQDLVGVSDPDERRRRIIAAAERYSAVQRPQRRRGRTFAGVPSRNPDFTGRADALDQLDAILTSNKPAAITQIRHAAVQGMGGVGKTSLAVEYAHRFRNLYDGVWWCPADTRSGLMTSLAALAVELEAASPREAEAEEAAKAALRRLADQQEIWLLVYDNVTAPDEIADLLPASGAQVLITSRFADWSGWADEVSLDVLPIKEAVAFLQERAGRRDETGAETLAEALGCLPLALDHASAMCKRTQMSFATYATKALTLISAASRGVGYPRSVAATFDLAIGAAARHCPAAEILMAFVAQCAPARIPITLLEGAIEDEANFMAALATLAEVSLVKHDPFDNGSPAVTVHRLVQAVARVRANVHATAQHAAARLIARLATVYPIDSYDNSASWRQCVQLTPHLLAASEMEMTDAAISIECAKLLNQFGGYFSGRGHYGVARPLLERAMAIRGKVLGPEHPDTMTSLNNLALLREAITSNSLLSLASQLLDAREVRPDYEEALARAEKNLGPEHAQTAWCLVQLANLLRDQGDLARARPLSERALAIFTKLFGPDHPEPNRARSHLARLLLAEGDWAKARALGDTALAAHEKALGESHSWTKDSASVTADALAALGRAHEARKLRVRFGIATNGSGPA